jgi:hypothetical protein
MNAHILILSVRIVAGRCPSIRLDEGASYPNLEQEVERVDVGYFEADCGWRGTFATEAARRSKTVEWPHLKSAGSYEKCKS